MVPYHLDNLEDPLFFPRNAQVAFKLGHCFDHFGGAVECDVTAVAEVRSCWFFGPQPKAGGDPFRRAASRSAFSGLVRMTFSVFSWP